MNDRMTGVVLVVCCIVIGVATVPAWPYVVAVVGSPLSPPTPPLLEGAEARGGWWNGGCADDPELAKFDRTSTEALSPTIQWRLSHEFPPGTPEALLRRSIQNQGFTMDAAPCRDDRSIRLAVFVQSGGGFFGPYPAVAQIAWKVDAQGKIVWAKGNIGYTGP